LKAKHDFVSTPVLPDDTSLEPEVEAEASAEPLPTSIEQDHIEHEPETVHSDERAEGSPEIVLDRNTPAIELQSELEQETVAAETRGTDALIAAATASGLVAAEFTETKQSVIPTTEVSISYSLWQPIC
jgi:hypothetical protein